MPAIQCWNGQQVHERQDEREEGGVAPKDLPVPTAVKNAPERHQAAHLGGAAFREQEAHGAHVILEGFLGCGEACTDGGAQTVFQMGHGEHLGIVRCRMHKEAQASRAVRDGVQLQHLSAALDGQANGRLWMGLDGFAHGLEVGQLHVANREDAVAHFQPRHAGATCGIDPGNLTRIQQREGATDALVNEGLAEFLFEFERHHFAVPQHIDLRHAVVEAFHAEVAVIVERLAVVAKDAVAVLKAEGLEFGVDVDGMLVGEFGFTPHKQHAGVDDEAEDEVDDDAAQHDDEALPSGLGTELPRLGRLGHLLGVHALVDHACDLDVAAQRQPANAPFRFADLLLEQRKPGVHEEIEFFDAGLEGTGGPIVAKFVENHQNGQAQQKLCGFDQGNHDANVHSGLCAREEFTHRCSQRIQRGAGEALLRPIFEA